jgi:hypothetical protein
MVPRSSHFLAEVTSMVYYVKNGAIAQNIRGV